MMKCDNCQTEIESGMVYCPKCGKPVQLVPNYNELEEELLSKIVEDKDATDRSKFATGVYKPVNVKPAQSQAKPEKKEGTKNKSQNRFILIIFICAILFGVGLMLGIMRYNYTHTYEYRMNLGNQAYNDESYSQAIDYYLQADKINSSFDSLYKLGLSYYKIKDYESAEGYFKQCLELESDNPDVYKCLLNCYDKLSDEDAIYALYEAAPNDDIKLTISSYIIVPPDFSLEEGEYEELETLHITSIDDYSIYYTLDGKDPTKYGKLYKKEIELEEGTTTVNAVCLSDDGKYSDVITKTYTIVINTPDQPEVSLVPGTYPFPTVLTVTNMPENCNCYYTLNGQAPDTNSYLYDGGFNLPYGTNTIRIIYVNDEGLCSEEYEAVYTSQ